MGAKIPTGIGCPCDGMMIPMAHDTGDGWTWGLECNLCGTWWGDESPEPPYPWPFDGDYATATDWHLIGVVVI